MMIIFLPVSYRSLAHPYYNSYNATVTYVFKFASSKRIWKHLADFNYIAFQFNYRERENTFVPRAS